MVHIEDPKNIDHLLDEYAPTMQMLEAYDHNRLNPRVNAAKPCQPIDYPLALKIIASLKFNLQKKKQASDLFGREREPGSLKSSLNTLYQSFDGQDLYPGLEEKAAHLIYLIIKNHPFIDGNKRIGAFLFVNFVYTNNIRGPENPIENNELINLALLIASSRPNEKNAIIKLIISLLNRDS